MTPLEDQITSLWGEITAATHRFLVLIAELDRTEGWMGAGMTSCAQWLNLHCGIGEVAAREKLRVAHAIAKLPLIDEAFRQGKVSYSKVRAMTRVATQENEAVLLNIARYGTASHVERTVRQFRRLERIEAAQLAAESHRQRAVHFRHADDDAVLIQARLPAEVGELVMQAIEEAAALVEAETCNGPDEPDFSYDGFARRRAEGLRLMAESFLAGAEKASNSPSDRYQVVVHIDQRLLSDLATESPEINQGLCELKAGVPLAVETARRLACDGALVGLVENEAGEPLNVGRKTRAIPIAIKRALQSRDGGCRFPGCTHTRYTEGHHIAHWAEGGETKLKNLITLCHFHHHLVHEGGYGLERTDTGDFLFTTPDGKPLEAHICVEKCFRGIVSEINRDHGIEIDAGTVDTRWGGERMDYSMAINALLAARERGESAAGNGS